MGASAQAPSPVTLDIAVVGTFQDASTNHSASEFLTSTDMVLNFDWGPGALLAYVEGSSSPQLDGVSSTFTEANGDAGTALDSHGNGRFQLSELRYVLPIGGAGVINVGLLDTTVFLDASSHATPVAGPEFTGIANDETTQFLGNGLVNNPLIEFPDYTLGATLSKHSQADIWGMQLALTASNGLADNPETSYTELLDIGDSDKGVFAAAEGHWRPKSSFLGRLGVWSNTRDHDLTDGRGANRSSYGVYSLLATDVGPGLWNLRLAWADPDVSAGESFISLATEQPLGFAVGGLGLARTQASAGLGPRSDDILQVEAFLRFTVNSVLQVSPDIQYIENSGFDSHLDAFVYGIRFAAFFSPGSS